MIYQPGKRAPEEQSEPQSLEIAALLADNDPGAPIFKTIGKYNDSKYRVSFEDTDDKRLEESIRLFRGKNLRIERFAQDIICDYVIPEFIKLTSGKVLRPEAIANILSRAILGLRDNQTIIRNPNAIYYVSTNAEYVREIIY